MCLKCLKSMQVQNQNFRLTLAWIIDIFDIFGPIVRKMLKIHKSIVSIFYPLIIYPLTHLPTGWVFLYSVGVTPTYCLNCRIKP